MFRGDIQSRVILSNRLARRTCVGGLRGFGPGSGRRANCEHLTPLAACRSRAAGTQMQALLSSSAAANRLTTVAAAPVLARRRRHQHQVEHLLPGLTFGHQPCIAASAIQFSTAACLGWPHPGGRHVGTPCGVSGVRLHEADAMSVEKRRRGDGRLAYRVR